ncbi:MAG: 16S rRNA (uracil(1498)-N(3))-methyltransferase [Alphaproteobacteria bacterium]
MSQRQPKVRLFVEAGLAAGVAVPLSTEQAHYAARVMRLPDGASIALFNGRDGEWSALLAVAAKGRCTAVPRERLRHQAAVPDLHLLCAPPKRQAFDLIVQKATELGVAAIRPVLTERTVPDRVNLQRLGSIAREAAEQSERLDVPAIEPPRALGPILGGWDPARRILLCDERGRGQSIANASAWPRGGSWAVLTGPEGGFTARELDALRDLPFVTSIGLGPRILRAETAAIAALAVWQALLGDWDDGPPPDPLR